MKHPFYELFHLLLKKGNRECKKISPLSTRDLSHTPPISTEYKKMGSLILAGGQASRLKASVIPKGCIELPFESTKTLFQIFFERIKHKGIDLPLAIMTSPLNHRETVAFLQNHDYFGLTNVKLFQQGLMPVCDDQGFMVFDDQGKMVQSPDGNGKALFHLYHSGIWKNWEKTGVEVVQVIPVDNILAQPFDSELLGGYHLDNSDLVLRVIKRKDPTEQLGVVGINNGRISVCEYSELASYTHLKDFIYGNSGHFICTLDFVEQTLHFKLPWHIARKQIFSHDKSKKMWAWKFETFIFDLFPLAQDFTIVVGNRKDCFAPIKNLVGSDSIESASQALIQYLRRNS